MFLLPLLALLNCHQYVIYFFHFLLQLLHLWLHFCHHSRLIIVSPTLRLISQVEVEAPLNLAQPKAVDNASHSTFINTFKSSTEGTTIKAVPGLTHMDRGGSNPNGFTVQRHSDNMETSPLRWHQSTAVSTVYPYSTEMPSVTAAPILSLTQINPQKSNLMGSNTLGLSRPVLCCSPSVPSEILVS